MAFFWQTATRMTRLEHDLENVCAERDQLIAVLRDFEGQLAELQGDVEGVTVERDNIAGLYEQVSDWFGIVGCVGYCYVYFY